MRPRRKDKYYEHHPVLWQIVKERQEREINALLLKLSFTRAPFFTSQTPTWSRLTRKLSDAFLNLITAFAVWGNKARPYAAERGEGIGQRNVVSRIMRGGSGFPAQQVRLSRALLISVGLHRNEIPASLTSQGGGWNPASSEGAFWRKS